MAKDITQNLILKTSLQDGISKEINKAATASTRAQTKIDKNVRKNISGFKRLIGVVRTFRTTLATIKAAVPGVAALAAVVGGGMGFLAAARGAMEFGDAMAEVSTLVDTTLVDVGALKEGVLGISNAFGATPVSVGKGLYQTISSGAVAAADSIELLTKAQKLAVAGVSTTAQAVDVLTTSINAYGFGVDEATRVSDVLFETVKQGKTTIPELAQNMGRAIPLAATLGVTIEELGAAVAAMTKGGIATDQAVVSLRGAMAALISPTTEAAEILANAGVDISKNRIEADGLVGVLGELEERWGKQPDVIAAIIPNIRALTGVLALTGKQAKEFRRILKELEASGGSTEEAFKKFLEDPAFRARVNIQNLKNAFLEMGNSIVNSFNDMIERGGGIERLSANIEAFGKGIGAAFGVATSKVGDLLGNVDQVIEAMGGAERFGQMVTDAIAGLGAVMVEVSSLVTDTLLTLIITLGEMQFALADTLGLFGDSESMRGFAATSEEASMKVVDLEAELQGLIKTRDEWVASKKAEQGFLFGTDLEDALQLDKSIEELEKDIASLNRIASAGIEDDAAPWGERSMGRILRTRDGLEKLRDAYFGVKEASEEIVAQSVEGAFSLDPDIERFQGDLEEWFSNMKLSSNDVFSSMTEDTVTFAQKLSQIKAALEGNEQALLNYEIQALRVQATLVANSKEQLAAFNATIDAIKRMKEEQIAAARQTQNQAAVKAWNDAVWDSIQIAQKRIDAEDRLADNRSKASEEAIRLELQTRVAHGRSFDERMRAEQRLIEIERDRHVAELEALGGLEDSIAMVSEAYDQMIDKLDPAELRGWTGALNGASDALDQFADMAQNDAAFAFEVVTRSIDAFSNSFANAFVDFVQGTATASEALSAFASSFLSEVSRMMAQRAAINLLGAAFSVFGVGADPRPTGVQGPLQADGSFAMGGVLQGGIKTLHAYANGGPVVKSPHMALVGEGQYNEAIVPLPDGRSIPVDMRGGAPGTQIDVSPTIQITVTSLDPRGAADVVLQPEVQEKLRAALADTLVAGTDSVFVQSVRGVSQ